jgi:uncharacterized membrane protein
MALFAAVALAFIATAIPLQLDNQWITVGWALEAAAVWWLYGKLPHRGLTTFGAILFASVGVRLLFNWDNVLHYEPKGLPILNWILYTYGVPALCCFLGARWLARAEARLGRTGGFFGPGAFFLGLVLVFALLNLEIVDYFSAGGRFVELTFQKQMTRDLVTSVCWGIYAMTLLAIALWRGIRPMRLVALGFLYLTVAKVFLYDLSSLEGVYRVFSLLLLGFALIVVSLIYQKFVVARVGAK